MWIVAGVIIGAVAVAAGVQALDRQPIQTATVAKPQSGRSGPPAGVPESTTPGSAAPSPTTAPKAALTIDPNGATLTPYPVPDPSVLAVTPGGYRAVFVENLGRHGSRTLTGGDHGERAVDLWKRAKREDKLTDLGAELGEPLIRLDATMAKLGKGQLTSVGRDEWRGIGDREGRRLPTLFGTASDDGDKVRIVTSGRTRAVDSSLAFTEGLAGTAPDLEIDEPKSDKDLLKFDNTDRDYRAFLRADDTWRPSYERATAADDLDAVSRRVLERLYRADFVAGLDDPADQAKSLWQMWRVAPALREQVKVDLSPFLASDAAAAFAFKQDARYFYSRGPGPIGDDRSHRAAQVLLEDFFDAADARLAGGNDVAVFRFAHAEEITPFAALLELPDSQPLPKEALYSWDVSPFRTAAVTPLAANISWTVWKKPDAPVLVSVSANEQPTTLGRGCRAQPERVDLYTLTELRRCLAP